MEERIKMKRDVKETELFGELKTKKFKVRTMKKLEKGRIFEGGGVRMVRRLQLRRRATTKRFQGDNR